MPSRRRGEIVEINVAEVGVQVEAGIDEGDADAPSVDALHREAERRGELRTGQVPITLTGWRACRDHRHVERNGLDVGVAVELRQTVGADSRRDRLDEREILEHGALATKALADRRLQARSRAYDHLDFAGRPAQPPGPPGGPSRPCRPQ